MGGFVAMPRIPPIPQLVVRPYDPPRLRRVVLFVGLIWLSSLMVVGMVVWRYARLPPSNVSESAPMIDLRNANEALEQRIAVLERADQVGKIAASDLQQSLREREEEIAGLRADLAFYGRLVGGGARREGLAIHSVHVTPVADSHAWNVSVTLTQNLKRSQISNGRLQLEVEGVAGQQLKRIAWSDLTGSAAPSGWPFAFKYFQQVTGTIVLPEGFVPNRVRVTANAGGEGGRVEQSFAWTDAQANEEINNVQ